MKMLRIVISALLLSTAGIANAGLIEIFSNESAVTSLAVADALIAGTVPIVTDNIDIVDFNDGGDSNGGHYFPNDNPWPGGVITDFVARITGSFSTAATVGQLADFRISHDDGVRLTINGVVVEFPGITDDRDTYLLGLTLLPVNTVEIVFFERGGGASLELAARCSNPNQVCNQAQYGLLPLGDPISVPEPGSLGLLGLGLIGLGIVRRRRSA